MFLGFNFISYFSLFFSLRGCCYLIIQHIVILFIHLASPRFEATEKRNSFWVHGDTHHGVEGHAP